MKMDVANALRDLRVFYVVSCLIVFAVRDVEPACSEYAIQQAMQCAQPLGLGSLSGGPNAFINQGDASRAREACKNGELLTVVSCMERVKKACEHETTEAAHFINNMYDIEKTRRTIIYLCSNVKVYEDNAVCIARHLQDVDACAKEGMLAYKTQVSATANMDALMRFQCSLYRVAVSCSERVLEEKCSYEAMDLVRTVLVGLEPPHCASDPKYSTHTGGAPAMYRSLSLLLLSSLLAFACRCLHGAWF